MKPSEEKEDYIGNLKNFDGRERYEFQTYYDRKTMDEIKSINNKLYFFYALTIVMLIVFIVHSYHILK